MVKQVLFGLGRVAGAPINRGISWAIKMYYQSMIINIKKSSNSFGEGGV